MLVRHIHLDPEIDDDLADYDELGDECPMCGSPDAALLGSLGRLTWLRCTACGINFNIGDDQ
jgi:translation initiation factor 2 beta subunit (eIF-2beta)/eIF-5